MKVILRSVGLLCLLLATSASAADEPSTVLEGTVHFNYFMDLSDREDDDPAVVRGFEMERAYATLKKSWGDMAFRYTADVDYKFGTGNLNIYSKYIYLEHKGIIPDGKLLVGLHSPSSHGWVEKIWHYRSMAKTVSDEYKWTDSATFGLGLQGKARGGFFEYYVDFNNGNGYKTGAAKDGIGFALRAVVKPAAGFVLSGHLTGNAPGGYKTLGYALDENNLLEKDVLRDKINTYAEGVAGYESERFGIFAQYGLFTDNNIFSLDDSGFDPLEDDFPVVVEEESKQSGLSLFGRARLRQGTYGLARVDIVDPDTDAEDDGLNWIMLGIDHELHPGFFLQPSFRITSFQEEGADSKPMLVLTFFGEV